MSPVNSGRSRDPTLRLHYTKLTEAEADEAEADAEAEADEADRKMFETGYLQISLSSCPCRIER